MPGWKSINNGNNSRRPASISNIRTIFEKMLKLPKFCAGPASASPGPILFIVARTAVKLVVKSLLSIETASTDKKNIIVNGMPFLF